MLPLDCNIWSYDESYLVSFGFVSFLVSIISTFLMRNLIMLKECSPLIAIFGVMTSPIWLVLALLVF